MGELLCRYKSRQDRYNEPPQAEIIINTQCISSSHKATKQEKDTFEISKTISPEELNSITFYKNMSYLSLNSINTALYDAYFKAIESIAQLLISNCEIGIPFLQGISKIKELYIVSMEISDELINKLLTCKWWKSITILDISACIINANITYKLFELINTATLLTCLRISIYLYSKLQH